MMRAFTNRRGVVTTFLLGILISVPIHGAEVYRWQDETGTVHYSGQPVKGAVKLDVQPVPVTDLSMPQLPSGPDSGTTSKPQPIDYRIDIVNPADGAVLWRDDRTLAINLSLQPALAVQRGHRLSLRVDGEPRIPETTDTSLILHGMNRGEHSIQAVVIARDGTILAESEPVTVYHKQHHLGTPGNTQPPGSAINFR